MAEAKKEAASSEDSSKDVDVEVDPSQLTTEQIEAAVTSRKKTKQAESDAKARKKEAEELAKVQAAQDKAAEDELTPEQKRERSIEAKRIARAQKYQDADKTDPKGEPSVVYIGKTSDAAVVHHKR